jgi:hypothetical protein
MKFLHLDIDPSSFASERSRIYAHPCCVEDCIQDIINVLHLAELSIEIYIVIEWQEYCSASSHLLHIETTHRDDIFILIIVDIIQLCIVDDLLSNIIPIGTSSMVKEEDIDPVGTRIISHIHMIIEAKLMGEGDNVLDVSSNTARCLKDEIHFMRETSSGYMCNTYMSGLIHIPPHLNTLGMGDISMMTCWVSSCIPHIVSLCPPIRTYTPWLICGYEMKHLCILEDGICVIGSYIVLAVNGCPHISPVMEEELDRNLVDGR